MQRKSFCLKVFGEKNGYPKNEGSFFHFLLLTEKMRILFNN